MNEITDELIDAITDDLDKLNTIGKKPHEINLLTRCIHCKALTEVHSNPMYMWECESCGYEGSYRKDVEYISTWDYVKEILIQYLQS